MANKKDRKTVRARLCWLLGHSFICLHRTRWDYMPNEYGYTVSGGNGGSTSSGWSCQHCGKLKFEQWDT